MPELWPGTQLQRPDRSWHDILSGRRVRDADGAHRAQAVSVSVSRLLVTDAEQFVRSPCSVASATLVCPVASCRLTRVLCPCAGSLMDHATNYNTSVRHGIRSAVRQHPSNGYDSSLRQYAGRSNCLSTTATRRPCGNGCTPSTTVGSTGWG